MSMLPNKVNWPKGAGEKLGDFFESNQRELVVILGTVFAGLTCFALGRVSALPEKEGVVFQPATVGGGEKMGQTQPAASTPTAATANQPSGVLSGQQAGETRLVGSKSGKKYHWPWCSSAKKIKAENQIWFNSEKEALAAGFTKCSNFDKLAPAGYNAEL